MVEENFNWESRLLKLDGDKEFDYGTDILALAEKIERVKLYRTLLTEKSSNAFEKRAHAITAIQNIHFIGDIFGKLLAHCLIGENIQVWDREKNGLKTVSKFYIWQVIGDLKRQSDYLNDQKASSEDFKKVYTDVVNSLFDFFSFSSEWKQVSFVSNKEKHERFFENGINKGKFELVVINSEVKREVLNEEVDAEIEELKAMGLKIENEIEYRKKAVKSLQSLHKVSADEIEEWEKVVITKINNCMDKICDYKAKKLESEEE